MSACDDRPQAGDILVLIGTRAGALLCWSDPARRTWRRSHHHAGANVNVVTYDERDGGIYAATDTPGGGPAIARSADGGRTWRPSRTFPAFADGRQIDQVWQIAPGHAARPGEVWAGTRTAGLFRSADDGATWVGVDGLNDHPSAPSWEPGGGGLILHTIVTDPSDPARLYACISTGGAFRSDDAGATWRPINRGVLAEFLPESYPETGQCVHKMALHPTQPGVLYQQNHCGVYRSDDAGLSWTDISAGLPSRFGFPLAVHPHDPQTIYVVPLVSDHERVVPGGRMAVWRSRDGGANWHPLTAGLPERDARLTILREALAVDPCDEAGIYVGTTSGHLFHSRDEGEHWELLADGLPSITSVNAARVVA